jgi:hypothetical protein
MADPAYIDEATGALTDGEAWVGIATTTLASDAASVTFTSTDDGQVGDWSQYMDLVLISYGRGDRPATASESIKMRLNDDTGSNYSRQYLLGDGATVSAGGNTTGYAYAGVFPAASASANIFGSSVTQFLDINSGKYKSMMGRWAGDMDGEGRVDLFMFAWKKQEAVTKIYIYEGSGNNLVEGSRFDLFGVLPRMVS